MRNAMFAATARRLAERMRRPQTSQANNAQANMSSTASPTGDSDRGQRHGRCSPRTGRQGHRRAGDARAARRHGSDSARRRSRSSARSTRTPIDLAAISRPQPQIATPRAKDRRAVPGRHGPRRRQDRRQARHLAEPAGLRCRRRRDYEAASGVQRGGEDQRRRTRSRRSSATSGRAARPATTSIARRCTTELARRGKQPVWDLPVRLVHWLLAALIAFSWWSVEYHHTDWHIWSGCAVLTLLIFRLLWGVVGSSTARFSSFVRGPRRSSIICAAAGAGIGHNAARRAQRRRAARRTRAAGRPRPDRPGRGRHLRGAARRSGQLRHVGQGAGHPRGVVLRPARPDRPACRGHPLLPLPRPQADEADDHRPGGAHRAAPADAARQMVGRPALPGGRHRDHALDHRPRAAVRFLIATGAGHIAAMLIRTEQTPNPATRKFLPGQTVMEAGTRDFADARVARRPRRSPPRCSTAAWSKASSSAATSSR